MTLNEYYEKFDTIEGLDQYQIHDLQHEFIFDKLNPNDRYDFFAWKNMNYFEGKEFIRVKNRKTMPKIWKFIRSSLPLYSLFAFADNRHYQRLYKRYKDGDTSVMRKIEDYYG